MISNKRIDDSAIEVNTGEVLDNSNAHEMADLLAQLQEEGTKHIFVNMAELEFLSSAGVGAILGSVETSREMGGDIILFNLSRNIRNVIEVLDLQDFFTIAVDRQNAIEATKL